MSTSGLTNQYQPTTLDGLSVIDVNELYIDGNLVDLNNLVPYVGADKTIDVGSQPIQTTYTATLPQDVVNFQVLTDAIDGQDIYNADQFLDKLTTTAQTVAGAVSFQNDVNMTSRVVTGTNYQTVLDSATVTVSQYFGTISNVGSVYQATTQTGGDAVLSLFSITAGERASFTISFRIDDPVEAWFVEIYQSADNITPVGVIPIVELFPIGDNTFHILGQAFTASTTGFICARISSGTPSATVVVEWKDMATFGMGVQLTNATYPSLTADRVAVLNERKQLVSSGISTTKLGYLDNVSSDIQTQINAKVSKAGDSMTGALDMGTNKVTTTYVPVNGPDLINKTYGDATYATPSALAGYALLAGANTFTGSFNQFQDGTQTTTGILSLKNNTNANADVGFELNASNQSSTAKRLGRISFLRNTSGTSDYSSKMGLDVSADGAIYKRMLTLHPTDGVSTETNSLTIGGALTQLLGNTADFANALKVNQTVLGFSSASFLSTGMPLGINGGTITTPTAGVYRLTAVAGTAAMSMRLSGFTPAQGGVYAYQFTGMRGSVTLVQKVIKDLLTSVISTEPTSQSVATTPGVIQGFFTIPNPVTSAVCFLFEATSIDPWVEWSSFVLRRGDTEVTGVLTCGDAVSVAGSATVAGLLTSGSNLSVLGGATVAGATACNTITTTGNVGIGTATTTAGPLTIYEATGSAGTGSAGSMVFSHGNTNGSQSIIFTSKNNAGSDYGFIQFIDTVTVSPYTGYNYFNGAGAEVCALVIGVQNDGVGASGCDSIILASGGIVLDATKQAGGNSAGVYIKGNVGIGSTSPGAPLVIQYDGGEGQYIVLRNPQFVTAGFTGIEFNHNDTRYSRIDSYLAGSNRTFLRFFTGNTGGGTTERLTLTDYGAFLTGTLRFANNGSGLYWGDGYSRIVDDSQMRICTDDEMFFNIGCNSSSLGTEKMRIKSDIIFMSVPLKVYNSTTGSYTEFSTGGFNYIRGSITYIDSTVAQTYPAFIDTNGSTTPFGNGALQITAFPSSQFGGRAQDAISCKAFNDGNYIIISHNTAGTSRGQIAGVNSSSIAYQTSSDRRLKDNVHTIEDSLGIVNRLKPVHFRWINDDEYDFGFIAQEVYKVLPQMRPNLTNYIRDCTCKREDICCGEQCEHCQTMNDEPVDEEGKPKYYSLDYGKFTPYLCGAIQEQQKMIDEQRKRVEVLEAREVMWEKHAREAEAKQKATEERLAKAEANLEKVAGLLSQLISKT